MADANGGATGFSRRLFLDRLASVGGTGLLLAGMDALGMGIASAQEAPPPLGQGGRRARVVVLGAGLAGLTSAYELSRAGYDVTVLEARAFAGGRVQTARKGHVLTELGGERQVCDFDDGLYINIGPWRIPYHHHSTLHYTRHFGVPLELFVNDNDHSYVYFEKGTGPLAGRPVRKQEIAADLRGQTAELLAKQVNQGALDQRFGAEDKALFLDYLRSEGYLTEKDFRYAGTEGRGFLVDPGAGLDPGPGKPSVPHTMGDVLRSGTWRMLASVADYDQQRTMFQPAGGMDRIPAAFVKALKAPVRYSTKVERIAQDNDGVTIGYVDGKGARGTISADYCICAIPLSVLRNVELQVSDGFRKAIAGVSYALVGKLGVQMKRRFWEENHRIYGGHVFFDDPSINSMSLPSTGWQGEKGVLLGYYNFGANAARISALSPAERRAYALAAGQKVFPEYAENAEGSFSVAWHRVEHNLGGWAQWSEDGRRDFYPTLNEPDGRVYLAGEHLSYLTGWQAGAIESAWAQIAKLHRRVQA